MTKTAQHIQDENIDDDIRERMAKKRATLERKCRAKLSTEHYFTAIKSLMTWGVATAEDWGVVAERIGSAKAIRLADSMGFPVQSLDDSNSPDYK